MKRNILIYHHISLLNISVSFISLLRHISLLFNRPLPFCRLFIVPLCALMVVLSYHTHIGCSMWVCGVEMKAWNSHKDEKKLINKKAWDQEPLLTIFY